MQGKIDMILVIVTGFYEIVHTTLIIVKTDCFRGPQTIEDLQQKLAQLTSQPSELGIGGTPPSHPATPHMPLSYDTYMQTLQQKLASISMTGGTHVVSLCQNLKRVKLELKIVQDFNYKI